MASALENYVNNVRTLSASGNFRDLTENLNDTIDLLVKNWSILDNVLETLDVQQHSLGVLFVIIAKFHSAPTANTDAMVLIKHFKDFINKCNGEQVRFATHAYYDLCHLFTNFIVNLPMCILGIKILENAIVKIRLCETQLTAVHADLCQLCLKAKHFSIAKKFLDVDVTSISTGNETRGHNTALDSNNDSKYFLLYFYYGGMIYTTIKDFERALYFFEACISTPAMTMSSIMLEAYKKFILVSLIHQGRLTAIPKYSSQVVSRFMKPAAQSYHELATAYATTNIDELSTIMLKHKDSYIRDSNWGLVKQVAASLYKKNIQRLTKTFLTLSLSDVADRVKLADAAEAERYILNMIKSGEIFATINQKDGMVVFKDNPECFNTPETFVKLQDDVIKSTELIKNINLMEEEIMLNPSLLMELQNIENENRIIEIRARAAKKYKKAIAAFNKFSIGVIDEVDNEDIENDEFENYDEQDRLSRKRRHESNNIEIDEHDGGDIL